jgi:hypothetical protein
MMTGCGNSKGKQAVNPDGSLGGKNEKVTQKNGQDTINIAMYCLYSFIINNHVSSHFSDL